LIVPPEVQEFFSAITEYVAFVRDSAHATLAAYCSRQQYALLDRTKTLESLSEKFETGRLKSFDEVNDLYGATIIVPTHSHEPSVLNFLRSMFEEVATKRRGESRKSPDVFRFDETRFYGRLKRPEGDPKLLAIVFEVQIRSAFEHAWQAVTHDLVYKNQIVDWRRVRLASHLKALVEQADLVAENFSAISSYVRPSEWEEIDAQVTLINYFSEAATRGLLPEEFIPKDWSRLAQNLVSLLRAAGRARPRAAELTGNLREDSRRVIEIFSKYLDGVAREKIPRSLSLFQLIFGVLITERAVSLNTQYVVLINESLQLAFPKVVSYASQMACA
jgi:ppGpp synthetase/RelA/SpoT-type nucleotidyltranferase